MHECREKASSSKGKIDADRTESMGRNEDDCLHRTHYVFLFVLTFPPFGGFSFGFEIPNQGDDRRWRGLGLFYFK